MYLILALAPEITEPPNKVETVDGRAITIGCKNFGVPKPHVKWTRNNIELTGGRNSILDNGDLQIRLVSINLRLIIYFNKLNSKFCFLFLSIKLKLLN